MFLLMLGCTVCVDGKLWKGIPAVRLSSGADCTKSAVFDLNNQQWTPSINPSTSTPSPRVGHGSVTFNEKIYVFGGRVGADMSPLNDLYVFDPANGEWEKIEQDGDVPQARSYFSMTASEVCLSLGSYRLLNVWFDE